MFEIGSEVRVKNVSGLTAEPLRLWKEDFDEFLIKARGGEHAILYDFYDDTDELAAIVFEDGLEISWLEVTRLELIEDDESEDNVFVCPRLSR